ncbi:MAG TPA: hypothetical protein IGS40_26620 [Trichormus sp. M33_DOE_039]|nr:hypothetical protein [Trichormus sp. M33_DOE_039]
MYFKLQGFLSRCQRNLLNNHKNSIEITKITNQGKIILNKPNLSQNSRQNQGWN